MPILVQVDELQPGMRLSEAFVWKGRIMLPGAKEITNDDVDILRRKYPGISLQIGDPVLDSMIDFEDDSHEREVAQTAARKIAGCMSSVNERFASRADIGALNFDTVRRAAGDVIDYLKDNPVSAALLSRSMEPGNYLSDHSGNVFYLSMVLGSAVRDYVMRERMRQTAASDLSPRVAMNLLPLGLGSMFMDLGMYPLQHLVTQAEPLTPADRDAINNHPITGADMLPDMLPPGVKMIVRAHHENYDGSGYPNRLAGPSLHIFTRIVRLCDAYDAATSTHVFKQAKSPARAMWEISAGPYRRFFDPVLAKMFMSLIQPFAVGAKIKLSDGRYGVVCRYNRRNPFAPTLIVAFDETGARVPNEALGKPMQPGVDGAPRLAMYADEDLSFIYDIEQPEAQAMEPACAESAFEMAFP